MIGHLSAYANTLTAIIPDLYAGQTLFRRELVGSSARIPQRQRAAVGQSVVYDIAPTPTAFNVTPAMSVPEPDNFTTGAGSLTINKLRRRCVRLDW